MMRGPLIHGVLLIIALTFAYQSWTKEKTAKPKTGDVEVWKKPVSSLQKILYETKDRTVAIERRTEGGASYLWATEVRITKKPKRAKKKPPAADKDAGPSTPEPEPETITTTREFPVGTAADEAFENMASLRALRDLGELSEDKREKFGLSESTDNITLVFSDGERSLILGGRVYGSADRYVLDTETNRGYAVAGVLIRPVHAGESGLRLKKLHKYDKEDVARVVIAQKGQQPLTLNRIEYSAEGRAAHPGGAPKSVKKKGWADSRMPDKPDQTLTNFLDRIDKLRPTAYEKDVDESTLTTLASIEYSDSAGKKLGQFELFKQVIEPEPEPEPEPGETPVKPDDKKAGDKKAGDKKAGDKKAGDKKAGDKKASDSEIAKPAPPKPEKKPKITFYVRTERTRVLGRVPNSPAALAAKDLLQMFAP